jgi:hypothetical protein
MTRFNVTVAVLGVGLPLLACSGSSQKPIADGAVGDTSAAAARNVDCGGECTFAATYTVSTDGEFANVADEAILSPAQAYQHVARSYNDAGGITSVSCAPALPACTDGGPVGACDIAQDLADPAVQAALAQSSPPFFGRDTRPTDGNAFSFMRDDGHGFEVGDGTCTSASCVPVPAAIARLKSDLGKMDAAMILSAECAALSVNLTTAGGS